MGRFAEETDLLPVATTPFAKEEMDAQPDARPQSERAIHRLGLQPRGFAATGRKLAHPSPEGFQHVSEPIHYVSNR